jgi:hypothetical protein
MIFRRLAVWLTNFFLGLFIFLLATVITLIFTIGSANYIKNNLASTGFYNKFTGSILKLATAQSVNDANSQNVINELTPVIERAITPKFVQTSFETAIDAFDNWLSGDTKSPSFNLDLSKVKTDLKNEMVIYLQNKVNAMPPCQSTGSTIEIDPINAVCRPPVGLTQADYQLAADNFISTVPLLDNQKISLDSLSPESNNKSIWQKVPTYNKYIRLAPWFLGVIIVLGISLIFVLSRSKARAIKVIGHTFLWGGSMLLVSGALSIIVLSRNSSGFTGRGSAEQIAFVQDLIAPSLAKFAVSYGLWALYFGAGYALVGAVCYIIDHKIKLKTVQNGQSQQDVIDQ